ncbi:hypothetical protein ABID70_001560 [Clavibacter michiganensis]
MPAATSTAPAARSLPCARTKAPGSTGAAKETVASGASSSTKRSGVAASMGTIASAPGGTGAPVMQGAAVPGARGAGATPAGMRGAIRRDAGRVPVAPARSAARTA